MSFLCQHVPVLLDHIVMQRKCWVALQLLFLLSEAPAWTEGRTIMDPCTRRTFLLLRGGFHLQKELLMTEVLAGMPSLEFDQRSWECALNTLNDKNIIDPWIVGLWTVHSQVNKNIKIRKLGGRMCDKTVQKDTLNGDWNFFVTIKIHNHYRDLEKPIWEIYHIFPGV